MIAMKICAIPAQKTIANDNAILIASCQELVLIPYLDSQLSQPWTEYFYSGP